ncbi:MAG TPA: hypothetical protein VIG28_07015 [Leifsonia sp.]|jgi:hypothetical protein
MDEQRDDPDHSRDGYEIRITGHLDDRWSDWFDGAEISRRSDGTTVIRAEVTDQAALHGLLQKVRDVGMPLQSVIAIRLPPLEAESLPRGSRDDAGRQAIT